MFCHCIHSAFFSLHDFGDVSCVIRTAPIVPGVVLIHALDEVEGCDSKQAETSRIKKKQAACGPNVRTKVDGNCIKLDKRKFVLVRSGDAPPHGSLELRSQESARLALSRHVPVGVNVAKHCKQRSVALHVVFSLGFCTYIWDHWGYVAKSIETS